MNQNRLNHETHEFDVVVIGGGMAGLCAAIASARGGAKTALVHDRPVLGGNASSEVRMWICGAHGKGNKEAGILEEIQLENYWRNPSLNYSIWDSVLWGKAATQPNLTLFLNCSCADAQMDGNRIQSVKAWQLTSQTWHQFTAQNFVDCSGDSILAALTPAKFRMGREARDEWGEDIQPSVADAKTMGNTLLIQLRRTDEPQPFRAPDWAYRFEKPEDLPHRMHGVNGSNFWWIEIGGLDDTIRDAEKIGGELHKIAWGVWDYIKNRAPQKAESENWALEWLGALPGKRENRRFVGDHVLTQNEVRDGGKFDDIIAYGGWSMDDHHPAGMYYPGKPTVFHPAPSPYGIPYRSLYSQNIENLLFAGRNISVTHAALSSTRVMATCAILGQAAGTAAALCTKHGTAPRALSSGAKLRELQRELMDNDSWLPTISRPISELAQGGKLIGEGDLQRLRDGVDRDLESGNHALETALGAPISYEWDAPVPLGGVRLVFDSNLNNEKRMPNSYPHKGNRCLVPHSLVRDFQIETRDRNGTWKIAFRGEENYQRLVKISLGEEATGVRLTPLSTWGSEVARIFAFEPTQNLGARLPERAPLVTWREVMAKIDPQDLLPPENDGEGESKKSHAA